MHLRGYSWGSNGCHVHWLLRLNYSADNMDIREKKESTKKIKKQ